MLDAVEGSLGRQFIGEVERNHRRAVGSRRGKGDMGLQVNDTTSQQTR